MGKAVPTNTLPPPDLQDGLAHSRAFAPYRPPKPHSVAGANAAGFVLVICLAALVIDALYSFGLF